MNTTPRELDDHDSSEWGNVQLPGLSDEELHAKNWNVITAARIRANNPVYKEKAKQTRLKTITDPEWKSNHSNIMKELYQNNEVYRNNLIEGHQKRINNPEWIRKNKENCESRKNDPAYKEQMKQVAVKRKSNDSWIEGQKKKAINQYNPIITPEGCFMKYTLGVIHYMKIWGLKKGGADYRLRKLLDDIDNNDFKRISQEEYIMLTGKDIT
jgi:hypothetical protein